MVGKLLKHEFLRTRGPLLMAGAIAAVICLAAYGLAHISPFLANVPFFAGFAVAVVFTFGIQLYLAVDFYRSSFGRRGYFTHTLPVKGSTLVLTKVVYALLVTTVALLFSAGLLIICLLTADVLGIVGWDTFWVGLREVFGYADWFVWFMLISIAGVIIATVVQYYFAVAVGSEAWINRSGWLGPVVVFLIVYVVMQIVSLLAFVIPPSYDPILQEFSWQMPIVDLLQAESTSGYAGIPVSAFALTYVVCAVLVWRTVVSVSRKLELR